MTDILVAAEGIPAGSPFVGVFGHDSCDQPDVNRHTQILIDERYIDAGGVPTRSPERPSRLRHVWTDHERRPRASRVGREEP